MGSPKPPALEVNRELARAQTGTPLRPGQPQSTLKTTSCPCSPGTGSGRSTEASLTAVSYRLENREVGAGVPEPQRSSCYSRPGAAEAGRVRFPWKTSPFPPTASPPPWSQAALLAVPPPLVVRSTPAPDGWNLECSRNQTEETNSTAPGLSGFWFGAQGPGLPCYFCRPLSLAVSRGICVGGLLRGMGGLLPG